MMPGRRRLAAVAALGLLATGGLAACQSDPAVAAYVGDTEIRTKRVEAVVDALRTSYRGELDDELAGMADGGDTSEEQLSEYRSAGGEEIDSRLSDARDRVLMFLVLTEAGTKYADAEQVELPEPDLASAAQNQELPEDHPYVQVIADFSAVVGAVVQAQAEPGEPTAEDQREAFENLQVQGEAVDVTFEEVQQFLTPEVLAGPVGVRDVLSTVVDHSEVRVQPGFDLVYPVPVQLGQATSHLEVQISEPGPVRDAD